MTQPRVCVFTGIFFPIFLLVFFFFLMHHFAIAVITPRCFRERSYAAGETAPRWSTDPTWYGMQQTHLCSFWLLSVTF